MANILNTQSTSQGYPKRWQSMLPNQMKKSELTRKIKLVSAGLVKPPAKIKKGKMVKAIK
jgi:hypothetical protein